MNFTSILFAVATGASADAGPDPVRLLFLDASSCKFVIMQQSLSPHTPAENAQFDADRAKARADMERHAATAIGMSGDSADMKDAIRTFHETANAYCANPSSSTEEAYKANKKALDQRLTAAGR